MLTVSAFSQNAVYPPHWWAGMKNGNLQVMLNGKELGKDKPALQIMYDGVTIEKIHYVENTNYLFVDLLITSAVKPGKFNFVIKSKGKPKEIPFELKSRRDGKGTQFAQGVTASDFIYLIMPDRFSNGDPSNDNLAGMRDQSLNRDSIFHRHGGDLQGIVNHLDYLQELGVTALWLMPVLENDMPNRSEHGYAVHESLQNRKAIGW
jgi:Glycosidases